LLIKMFEAIKMETYRFSHGKFSNMQFLGNLVKKNVLFTERDF